MRRIYLTALAAVVACALTGAAQAPRPSTKATPKLPAKTSNANPAATSDDADTARFAFDLANLPASNHVILDVHVAHPNGRVPRGTPQAPTINGKPATGWNMSRSGGALHWTASSPDHGIRPGGKATFAVEAPLSGGTGGSFGDLDLLGAIVTSDGRATVDRFTAVIDTHGPKTGFTWLCGVKSPKVRARSKTTGKLLANVKASTTVWFEGFSGYATAGAYRMHFGLTPRPALEGLALPPSWLIDATGTTDADGEWWAALRLPAVPLPVTLHYAATVSTPSGEHVIESASILIEP